MDFEQYFAGIEPGGLTDKYEIKLLICYLLSTVKEPLSEEQLNAIFQSEGLVNYFSYTAALKELVENGLILPQNPEDKHSPYQITALGEDSALKLQSSLPRSLRDKVVDTAMKMIASLERNRNISLNMRRVEDGYLVECRIADIGSDLMRLELYASNEAQAEWMIKSLEDRSDLLYRVILAVATRDQTLISKLLKESTEQKD